MKKKHYLIEKWQNQFIDIGIKTEVYEVYLAYAEKILENKVPVIFSFSHLAALLGRTNSYLASVVYSANNHYRSFEIPKKSGGMRAIDAPYPALLECQYWILQNILNKARIHPKAFAYVKKKSIKQNALPHLNQECFLKLDIKDFYPSIKIGMITNVFKSFGYSSQVSFCLAAICSLSDSLPQGAPTSPVLSNIIFRSLDGRLDNLAEKLNLKYSRYADDIAFSGDNISPKLIDYVQEIIKSSRFEINSKKTILQKHKGKRILTGISISSDQLKVPTDYKRDLRQIIYFIEKFGLYSHLNKIKNKNPDYLLSLEGRIRFWLFIEPDNQFAQKAINIVQKLKSNRQLD